MKSLKYSIFIVSVMSISGCSWFGGGSCDPGQDPACNAPVASQVYSQQARWYCAGDFESRAWSCSHERPYAEILKLPTAKLLTKNTFQPSTAPQPKQKKEAWSSVVAARAMDEPAMPMPVKTDKIISPDTATNPAEQAVISSTGAKTEIELAVQQPAPPEPETETQPLFGLPNPAAPPSKRAALSVGNAQANTGEVVTSVSSTASRETQGTSTGDQTYDRFMDLPSGDFAIQLLASKTMNAIKAFAKRVDLSDPTILQIEVYANSLFVLILDTFSSYEKAQDMKTDWTSKYGDEVEPWIRTVGSLQNSMQPIGPAE